jgi:hypothetical protein
LVCPRVSVRFVGVSVVLPVILELQIPYVTNLSAVEDRLATGDRGYESSKRTASGDGIA